MKKILILIGLFTILSGCASLTPTGSDEHETVLTFQTSEFALSDGPKGKTGIEVRLVHEAFDRIDLFIYRNGKVVDELYSGSGFSHKFLEALDQLLSEPADFVELAEQIRKENAAKGMVLPFVLDGSKQKLSANFGGREIHFEMWNLYDQSKFLAEHDPRFMNLKRVLDILLIETGRMQSGL